MPSLGAFQARVFPRMGRCALCAWPAAGLVGGRAATLPVRPLRRWISRCVAPGREAWASPRRYHINSALRVAS